MSVVDERSPFLCESLSFHEGGRNMPVVNNKVGQSMEFHLEQSPL